MTTWIAATKAAEPSFGHGGGCILGTCVSKLGGGEDAGSHSEPIAVQSELGEGSEQTVRRWRTPAPAEEDGSIPSGGAELGLDSMEDVAEHGGAPGEATRAPSGWGARGRCRQWRRQCLRCAGAKETTQGGGIFFREQGSALAF